MDYELAKKLKDAGFSQRDDLIEVESKREFFHNGGYHLLRENGDGSDGYPYQEENDRTMRLEYFTWEYVQEHKNLIVYIPTLEELIKEFGDRFGALTQFDREKGKGWFAAGHKVIWDSDEDGFIQCSGDEPEEAVANLWLGINNKNE